MKEVSPAQYNARRKNFSKLRIKGAYETLRHIADNPSIELREECRDYLKDASKLVMKALEMWDVKNIMWAGGERFEV